MHKDQKWTKAMKTLCWEIAKTLYNDMSTCERKHACQIQLVSYSNRQSDNINKLLDEKHPERATNKEHLITIKREIDRVFSTTGINGNLINVSVNVNDMYFAGKEYAEFTTREDITNFTDKDRKQTLQKHILDSYTKGVKKPSAFFFLDDKWNFLPISRALSDFKKIPINSIQFSPVTYPVGVWINPVAPLF